MTEIAGPREPARTFLTPEGVPLHLRIGGASERAGAFAVDVLIVGGLIVVMSLLALLGLWLSGTAGRRYGGEAMAVIWLLGFFLLRNWYFAGFELRPRAATPGKRLFGLRVVARDGGRLTMDAVFARNALRELEVFLPATFLFAQGRGVDAWLILLGVIWTGTFLLFPLFNRDRLRVGDLIAGTLVVGTPKVRLLPDLAQSRLGGPGDLDFSPAQLDVYGVKELHVLETVLRTGERRALATVADRIRAKIGWTGGDIPDRPFLEAYYKALRGRLEQRLLFGHRRKDKHDRA